MNNFRSAKIAECKNKICELKQSITFAHKNIVNLTNAYDESGHMLPESYIKAKIDKGTDNIEDYKNNISELESMITDVGYGEYDHLYKEPKVIVKKKFEPVVKHTPYVKEYNTQREYKYEYKNYLKIMNSIPDYMDAKLRNMPNNKGYIWRGMRVFGQKKDEGNEIILFEKMKGNVTRIHEYKNGRYSIYDKAGTDRKVLVSEEIMRDKR